MPLYKGDKELALYKGNVKICGNRGGVVKSTVNLITFDESGKICCPEVWEIAPSFTTFSTAYLQNPWGNKTTCKKIIVDGNSVTKMLGGFDGWASITEIEGVENLTACTSLGGMAFRNCTGLTEFTIPSQMITWYQSVFSGCSNLKKITIHALVNPSNFLGQKSPAHVFYGCKSLEEIILPAGWTTNIFLSDGSDSEAYTDVLTAECIKDMFSKLAKPASGTRTITLGAINLARVSASDIAVATAKGWIVS